MSGGIPTQPQFPELHNKEPPKWNYPGDTTISASERAIGRLDQF